MRKAEHPVRMYTNAGVKVHRSQAVVNGLEAPVWFDHDALANIMSMRTLIKHHRVTFDSAVCNAFFVHITPELIIKFECTENGLYAYIPPNGSAAFNNLMRNEGLQVVSQNRRSDAADDMFTMIYVE